MKFESSEIVKKSFNVTITLNEEEMLKIIYALKYKMCALENDSEADLLEELQTIGSQIKSHIK